MKCALSVQRWGRVLFLARGFARRNQRLGLADFDDAIDYHSGVPRQTGHPWRSPVTAGLSEEFDERVRRSVHNLVLLLTK